MDTKITATELARNTSEILDRVRKQGESFQVEQDGKVVAEIRPAVKRYTVADFKRDFAGAKVPEGLGADIEDARIAMGPLPDPWA